eukprot:TRINITY_DN10378_c0_g1_i1.p1 TRINITY_DN10378_c0_g1~~TRINITY_DN10378_c0_g1_i1.p1  ORF type:complete len:869 (+),score=175.36 TRINITY_DN10378_c0_g1_i1:52-2658(+)
MQRLKSWISSQPDQPSAVITYVWKRLIVMGPPTPETSPDLAAALHKAHPKRFLIWNLSGISYDSQLFDNQVLELGNDNYDHPPAMELLQQVCKSIRSWLRADPLNVAVLHCRSEMRWCSLVLACFLSYVKKVSHSLEGLMLVEDAIATVRSSGVPVFRAQRRYAMYFDTLRAGRHLSVRPLYLQRIMFVMKPISGPAFTAATLPFVQLFVNGRLFFSTSWRHIGAFAPEQGLLSINIGEQISGDVVMELCVTVQGGATLQLCSYAFHTGFENEGVIHLTEPELDGVNMRDWFGAADYFIDIIADAAELAQSPSATHHNTSGFGSPMLETNTGSGAALHSPLLAVPTVTAPQRPVVTQPHSSPVPPPNKPVSPSSGGMAPRLAASEDFRAALAAAALRKVTNSDTQKVQTSGDSDNVPALRRHQTAPVRTTDAAAADAPARRSSNAPPPPMDFALFGPPAPEAPVAKPRNTRRIHWQTLAAARMAGSVWQTIARQPKLLNGDQVEAIVAMFANVQTKKKLKSDHTRSSAGVNLLETRRASNIGILLARFHMPVGELSQLIRNMDSTALKPEDVQVLLTALPTAEEAKLLRGYKGALTNLAPPEQLFAHLVSIPLAETRLQTMAFMAAFQSITEGVLQDVQLIAEACSELVNSQALRILLQAILEVGNELNFGTRTGGAIGFHLEILTKLADYKATNSHVPGLRPTLLHVVAAVLAAAVPTETVIDLAARNRTDDTVVAVQRTFVQRLVAELPHIHEMSLKPVSTVRQRIEQLSQGLDNIETARRDSDVDAVFVRQTASFLTKARSEVEVLSSGMEQASVSTREACSVLGEDAAQMTADELCKLVDGLLNGLVRAMTDVSGKDLLKTPSC